NGSAGIYVSNGVEEALVDSCNVTGNGTSSGYGIVVNATSGAVTNVFIRNCDATGYSSYSTAIYVDGAGTNVSTVEITNCAGYSVPQKHGREDRYELTRCA